MIKTKMEMWNLPRPTGANGFNAYLSDPKFIRENNEYRWAFEPLEQPSR